MTPRVGEGVKQPRILVVDDERFFQEAIHEALSGAGYETVVVGTGEQALERALEPEIGVVVLDLQLPDIHGLEVFRRISEQRSDLRVVVLSAGDLPLRSSEDFTASDGPQDRRRYKHHLGHRLQMVGLHEMLFDDRRYDEDGSLTFRFAPIQYGKSPIEIKYDHDRLTKVIYDQFVEDDFRGIECERNAVYTECNQHPILGLMHYARVSGCPAR